MVDEFFFGGGGADGAGEGRPPAARGTPTGACGCMGSGDGQRAPHQFGDYSERRVGNALRSMLEGQLGFSPAPSNGILVCAFF